MGGKSNGHQYDNIIGLPHYRPLRHVHMSERNRAAQFTPFAALTGYEEAIRETTRLAVRKAEEEGSLRDWKENMTDTEPVEHMPEFWGDRDENPEDDTDLNWCTEIAEELWLPCQKNYH